MERLLIVDDEWDVVEYFERIFLQEETLELEIYKAHSAGEALDCLEKTRIDVVLSDIKMPKMNGLEMYDVIKKRWAECRVIFISGFLEFDYVYSSIQKKDVRYLTKLEPKEKIIETVKEVIVEIRESYNQASAKRLIQKQILEALPLLQNKFFSKLLQGAESEKEAATKRMQDLEINLTVEKSTYLIGGIFDNWKAEGDSFYMDKNVVAVNMLFEQQFSDSYYVGCYVSQQKYFIWILQEKDNEVEPSMQQDVRLNGKLEYLQNKVKYTLQNTITLTYYQEAVSWEEIPQVYGYIKRTLGYKACLVTEGIIKCCGYETEELWDIDKEKLDSQKQLARIHELEGYLELGKDKAYFEVLSQTIDCLNTIESLHYGPALEIYYRVMGVILKYINRWKLREKLVFQIELYKLDHLELHSSWKEATDYLKQISQYIFDIHFSDEQTWTMAAVTRVYNYINMNLDKDLSLNRLAEEVNLNTSYLSRLFKNVTNKNVYEYILECRMAKAVELLLKTSDKIQDIGISIGYDSAQSFTRVFRKYTGKTPSEYREEKIDKKGKNMNMEKDTITPYN